eukprot:g3009.t1
MSKKVIYDGQATTINEKAALDWLPKPLTFDLQDTPGIGPATENALRRNGVDNPMALLGQFLMLRREGMDARDHCNAMARYLKDVGIPSHRADIIYGCSEKLAILEQAAKLKAFYTYHLKGADLKEQLGKINMIVEKYSKVGFPRMWRLAEKKYGKADLSNAGKSNPKPCPKPLAQKAKKEMSKLSQAGKHSTEGESGGGSANNCAPMRSFASMDVVNFGLVGMKSSKELIEAFDSLADSPRGAMKTLTRIATDRKNQEPAVWTKQVAQSFGRCLKAYRAAGLDDGAESKDDVVGADLLEKNDGKAPNVQGGAGGLGGSGDAGEKVDTINGGGSAGGQDSASSSARPIAAWLADLHPSFAQYAPVFQDVGCDDVSLLPLLTSEVVEDVTKGLEKAGAKKLQQAAIEAALKRATGGDAKRANKESNKE